MAARDHDLRVTPAPEAAWPARAHPPPLSPDVVHVWSASAVRSAGSIERFSGWLTDDERARCGRFRFRGDQLRFTVGRGLVRTLVAAYAGCPPASVAVRADGQRKPTLALPDGAPDLRFNLAHSGALVLCAVSLGHELGVDGEAIRPVGERDGIVRRYFAPLERDALERKPDGERDAAFFGAWTAKEAVMKATGEGLGLPLASVVVPLTGEEAPFDVVLGPDTGPSAGRWRVRPLSPAPGYRAAVAHRADALLGLDLFHLAEDGAAAISERRP